MTNEWMTTTHEQKIAIVQAMGTMRRAAEYLMGTSDDIRRKTGNEYRELTPDDVEAADLLMGLRHEIRFRLDAVVLDMV